MAVVQPNQPLRPVAQRLLLAASACFLGVAACVTTTYALSVQTTPTDATSLGHVYKPGNGIKNPKLISSVDPSFPEGVHVSKIFQGISVIGIVVDRKGIPRDLHVTRSLTPAFDAEAIKAIGQYRFQPATKDGQPVPVAIRIEVKFQRF